MCDLVAMHTESLNRWCSLFSVHDDHISTLLYSYSTYVSIDILIFNSFSKRHDDMVIFICRINDNWEWLWWFELSSLVFLKAKKKKKSKHNSTSTLCIHKNFTFFISPLIISYYYYYWVLLWLWFFFFFLRGSFQLYSKFETFSLAQAKINGHLEKTIDIDMCSGYTINAIYWFDVDDECTRM